MTHLQAAMASDFARHGGGATTTTTSTEIDKLYSDTRKWCKDRGLLKNGKVETQVLKLTSEVGELSDAVIKNDKPEIKDAIGDIMVVLVSLSELAGTSLPECWQSAYDEIKYREGFLNEHGNFVKNTDAGYERMYQEFLDGNSNNGC